MPGGRQTVPRTVIPEVYHRGDVVSEGISCDASALVSVWTPGTERALGYGAGGDGAACRGGGLRDVSAPRPLYRGAVRSPVGPPGRPRDRRRCHGDVARGKPCVL